MAALLLTELFLTGIIHFSEDSDILPRRADYITHSLPSSKRERRPKPLERVVLSRSSVGFRLGMMQMSQSL